MDPVAPTTLSSEDLCAAATPRGALLLVRSILGFPHGTRVALLDVERIKPRILVDGCMENIDGMDSAAEKLGDRCRVGVWDALAQAEWTVAWTRDAPFELHRPGGKGFAQVHKELHRTGGGLSLVGDPTIQFTPLRFDAYVDGEWVHRGVRAFIEGREVPIHSKTDIEWMADPTYDALDLAMDAAWASLLAATLGACFGVPVEDRIR